MQPWSGGIKQAKHGKFKNRGFWPFLTCRLAFALFCAHLHSLESPHMWVWPQVPFGGHPPPKATGGPFPPARALPSPPSLSSPTPLALFATLRDGRLGWRGGGGSQRWTGRVLQAALGARPTSGGIRLSCSHLRVSASDRV